MTKRQRFTTFLAGLGLMGLLGFAAINIWPQLGARGAMALRPLIGNEAVSWLERIYLRTQDQAKQTQYELGLVEAAPPWAVSTATISVVTEAPSPTATTTPAATATVPPTPTIPPDAETTTPDPTTTAVPAWKSNAVRNNTRQALNPS